jgi:MSHA pilin protein MshD
MPVVKSQQGFSLIELIVGLVLTALALAFLSTVFFSAPERSVEPILQIRAAELGQSLMDEIMAKPYDETTPLGGVPPCVTCTSSLGAEAGESRGNYDDVDDYDNYCRTSAPYETVKNAQDVTPDNFDNYQMNICVIYDGNYDGVEDSNQNAKLIMVDIYTPTISGARQKISFQAYRSNF